MLPNKSPWEGMTIKRTSINEWGSSIISGLIEFNSDNTIQYVDQGYTAQLPSARVGVCTDFAKSFEGILVSIYLLGAYKKPRLV